MKTTIYKGSGICDHTLRTFVGQVKGASMWVRITNVLRIMNAIVVCLATSDDEYYVTADNKLYIVKK